MASDRKVEDFLTAQGLAEYIEAFASQGIEWAILRDLSNEDLTEIGVVALGHRRKLLLAFQTLRRDIAPTHPTGTDGEIRFATILFADIVDSTLVIQGLDAEAAGELLGSYVEVAAGAVTMHGGTIIDWLGDGLLAAFGVPLAMEDHARRACEAALDLHQRIATHAKASARAKMSLQMRVGLHSGEIVVSRKGDKVRTAGPAVHLAARMEQTAKPGAVQASRATWRLVERHFEYEALGTVAAKGFQDPVETFRIVRAKTRNRSDRIGRRSAASDVVHAALLGRDAEFAKLKDTLAALAIGHGAAVGIVGEAGVGKSRLIEELRAIHESRPTDQATPLWIEGRCMATDAKTSYQPYLEALRTLLGLQSGDSDHEKLRQVDASVTALAGQGHLNAPRAREIRRLLANMLSISVSADESAVLGTFGPEQLKNETLDAVCDYVTAYTRQQPMVLALEDLHWADSLSIELTSRLFKLVTYARLLVIWLSRLDPEHRWRRLDALASEQCGARYRRIELSELTDDDSRRLLFELLGIRGLPRALEALTLSRTQGNPFFLEEVVRSFVDAGVVHLEAGQWRMHDDAARVSIPETVQAVIQSRVDRLPDEERRILQSAAVIGRTFHRRVLAHLWADADELERGLWNLQRRGLVFVDRVLPEEAYSFKHVLSQETIYRALVRARRSELHERIGTAIEHLYAASLEEHWEDLAHHYNRTSNLEKSVRYLALAGEKSRRAFSNEASVDYYKQALARLGEIARDLTPDERNIKIAVLEGLGDVLEFSGHHENAVTVYGEALTPLSEGERIERGRVLRKIGKSLQVQRRIGDAFRMFDNAATALGASPASYDEPWWAERISIELDRALLAYFAAPLPQLSATLEVAKSLVEAHGTRSQRGNVHHLEALAALRRTRYVADNETVEIARIAAEASGDMNPAEVGMNGFIYGFCLLWAGRLEDSKAQLVTTLARAARVGDITLQSRCLTYLTLIHRKNGDVTAVERSAAEALAIAETGGMIEYLAQANANLAWVAGRKEDLTRWEHHAEIAWTLWQQLPAPGPYVPMAWIAAWPMLGLELGRRRYEHAVRLAAILLEPDRQPMPIELSRRLRSAVESVDLAFTTSELLTARKLAVPYGYL